VKDRLEVSFSTANKIVGQLESLGIITELTGGQRHRAFRYTPYLDLFTDSQPSEDQDVPVQMTESIGRLPNPMVNWGGHTIIAAAHVVIADSAELLCYSLFPGASPHTKPSKTIASSTTNRVLPG
jgi:hypothetical protein